MTHKTKKKKTSTRSTLTFRFILVLRKRVTPTFSNSKYPMSRIHTSHRAFDSYLKTKKTWAWLTEALHSYLPKKSWRVRPEPLTHIPRFRRAWLSLACDPIFRNVRRVPARLDLSTHFLKIRRARLELLTCFQSIRWVGASIASSEYRIKRAMDLYSKKKKTKHVRHWSVGFMFKNFDEHWLELSINILIFVVQPRQSSKQPTAAVVPPFTRQQ